MDEPVTIPLWCTGCRKETRHAYVGAHEQGLIRYQCQPCGRTRLLTSKEQRA